MNLSKWYSLRGPRFVFERGVRLLGRYSLTPEKATRRVIRGVDMLAGYGCAPTLPTPGRVVQDHPGFIRQLQERGVEIAVHSYDHIDLSSVPPAQAQRQLEKAAAVFRRLGIEYHGFRCPYLRFSDELLEGLPAGMFGYSSNRAVSWEVISQYPSAKAGPTYARVGEFYRARSSASTVCVPAAHPNLIEIPVCTPDDIQLQDGLGLGPEETARAWIQMLTAIHNRGELFNLIFHPELILSCYSAFECLLQEALNLQPKVWIARLQDVETWWREKANNQVTVAQSPDSLRITFLCSPRTSVLSKDLETDAPGAAWGDDYELLTTRSIAVPPFPRPFIGVDDTVPVETINFLSEQGYILETGKNAILCSIFLDGRQLASIQDAVQLIDWIETCGGPLVRYGRWPEGARSALCVSGDMDAITLLDYFGRLAA